MAAELYFLNQKLSGAIDFNKEMTALFQAGQFVFVPFTASDALEFDADSAVGEMHDRTIAGVARRINATLLTRDAQITSSGVVVTCLAEFESSACLRAPIAHHNLAIRNEGRCCAPEKMGHATPENRGCGVYVCKHRVYTRRKLHRKPHFDIGWRRFTRSRRCRLSSSGAKKPTGSTRILVSTSCGKRLSRPAPAGRSTLRTLSSGLGLRREKTPETMSNYFELKTRDAIKHVDDVIEKIKKEDAGRRSS